MICLLYNNFETIFNFRLEFELLDLKAQVLTICDIFWNEAAFHMFYLFILYFLVFFSCTLGQGTECY